MTKSRNRLLLLGSSHRTAPLEVRERLSVGEEQLRKLYRSLNELRDLEEILVLNTCNRIELYVVAADAEMGDRIERFLCEFHRFDRAEFTRYSYRKTDLEVVRHLFEVSAGIDSQMVGETEIFGQVKDSYSLAIGHSTVGPSLHQLFQRSFQAAKWARTHTGVGKGNVSVSNVAVNLAMRIFGKLHEVRILVLGTGDVGASTARALQSRGAGRITVTGRTAEKAQLLADSIGGSVLPFGQYPDELHRFDIIICSTGAGRVLVTLEMVEQALDRRSLHPLFLIDLSVPRNVDPDSSSLPNLFLYDLDDIATIANENLKDRMKQITSCRQVLARRAERVWNSLQGRL